MKYITQTESFHIPVNKYETALEDLHDYDTAVDIKELHINKLKKQLQ